MVRRTRSKQSTAKKPAASKRSATSKKPVTSKKPAASNRPAAGSRARTSRNSEQARRQRARRRKRQTFLFRLICGVLICAVIVLAPTVFFRVAHVTVSGDTRYTEQELIDATGVHDGDNMFFLDCDHIAAVLQAKYPYLDTVKLHRRLPSTLQIEVTDRVAVLSVEADGEYLLMDMTGKVLEKTADVASDTTMVSGADADGLEVGDTVGEEQEKLGTVLDLMELLTQYELNADVRGIDIEKAYDVRMQYADRYTILLGNLSELEHKIQFLQAILKEPSLPESGIIDLTDEKEARYRPADATVSDEPVDDAEQAGQSDEESTEDTTDNTDDGADDADNTDDTGSTEDADSTDGPGEDQQADSDTQTEGQTAGFVQAGKFLLKLI